MGTMRPQLCIFLLMVATSSAQNEFQEPNNDFNTDHTKSGGRGHGHRPPHPLSSFQIGPADVETGPNWSVNVFNVIRIQRNPNGGIDVSVQLPKNIFNRPIVNRPQGNEFRNTKRRRRNSLLPTSKSLDQEPQKTGKYQPLVREPNSVSSANEDKETTIRIGNFTIKTGNNWSVDLGKIKMKNKPEGGVDIQMDPSSIPKGRRNGENPYDDPSVDYPRKRRALDNWLSKLAQQPEGSDHP